jgi:chemotaxis protein CheX
MKAEWINPFLNSTINLFQQTFSMKPEVGQPYVLKNTLNHRWEISGVMVLTGNAIGVVAIRLPRVLTLKLLERSGLSWRDDNERDQLVNEMVSELVNVIAGNAATSLTEYSISVSVPFVVQGKNHSIAWPDKTPIIVIPFITPSGPFEVTMSMTKR